MEIITAEQLIAILNVEEAKREKLQNEINDLRRQLSAKSETSDLESEALETRCKNMGERIDKLNERHKEDIETIANLHKNIALLEQTVDAYKSLCDTYRGISNTYCPNPFQFSYKPYVYCGDISTARSETSPEMNSVSAKNIAESKICCRSNSDHIK